MAVNSLGGRTALITGAGKRIGRAIALALAKECVDVVVHYNRSEKEAEELAGELKTCGVRAWPVRADLEKPDEYSTLVERAVKASGKVDILVNNAAGNFVCPAERLSSNAWRAVLGIVLDGTFYCSQSFGKAMIARGAGQMLNVVATYAWTGMPGVVHSASAKAGVLAMTRSLAAEWARFGVRCNAIAPGPFHSQGAQQNLWPDADAERKLREKIPLGRFATAEEVAAQCLHLLSPASAYLTGECLVVDGGATLGSSMWAPGTRFTKKRGAESDAGFDAGESAAAG